MKKVLLVSLLFLLTIVSFGQDPFVKIMDAKFGTSSRIFPATGNGWMIFSSDTLMLSKFNSCGINEWGKKFATVPIIFGMYDFIQLLNGDYAFMQLIRKGNVTITEVTRLDPNGNIIWSNSYGDTNYNQYIYSLFEDANGNLFVYGNVEHVNLNPIYNVLMKMNANGVLQWTKFYDHGGKLIAIGTLPSQSAEFGHDSDVVATIGKMFPSVSNFSITASSQWQDPGYEPGLAIDGSMTSRWNAGVNGGNQWLQIDFGNDKTFNKTKISEAFNRVTSYKIQYWNGNSWINCINGTTLGTSKVDTFATVTASKVRLFINTVSELSASIYDFEVQLNNGPNLITFDTLHIHHDSGELHLGSAILKEHDGYPIKDHDGVGSHWYLGLVCNLNPIPDHYTPHTSCRVSNTTYRPGLPIVYCKRINLCGNLL